MHDSWEQFKTQHTMAHRGTYKIYCISAFETMHQRHSNYNKYFSITNKFVPVHITSLCPPKQLLQRPHH
jgi:hypothetical protein